MHHHGCGHPSTLSALIIIRTCPDYEPRSRISSLALFTATIIGRREASFDLVHARFDRTDSRPEIIAGLFQRIPKGTQLLVRQPLLPARHLLNTTAVRDLSPTDNEIIARTSRGTTLLPVVLTDDQLALAGEALGLEMPYPDSTPLKRNRHAPEQAMAMWSVYTQAFCGKAEARALLAAFHAWRLLERVKPLPF